MDTGNFIEFDNENRLIDPFLPRVVLRTSFAMGISRLLYSFRHYFVIVEWYFFDKTAKIPGNHLINRFINHHSEMRFYFGFLIRIGCDRGRTFIEMLCWVKQQIMVGSQNSLLS